MRVSELKQKVHDRFYQDDNSVFYQKRRRIFLIVAFVLPLIAMLGAEMFARGGLNGVFKWIGERPLVVVYNYLIYLALFFTIHVICNRLTLSGTIFVAVIVIYSIVNINKYMSSGLYFNPNDLRNQTNYGNFFKLMVSYLPLSHFLFGVVSISGTAVVLYLLQNRYRFKPLPRIGIMMCCIGMVLLGCNTFELAKTSINKTIRLSGFMAWEPNRNYLNNGMLGAFLGYTRVDSADQSKPDSYSKETMAQVQSEMEATPKQEVNEKQPDKVIVILAESLFDVTRLEGVEISIDPLKDAREDMYSNVIAGVVAGTTANTELEVLTGFSLYPLQSAAIPYTSIYRETPSLVQYFNSLGYTSTAMHTYYGDWYRRNEVYKNFGFKDFISADDMPNAKKKGYYISDDEMANAIIQQTNNDDKQFIFAITMQNHGPYNKGKYDGQLSEELTVTSSLSDDDNTLLTNYVQGVYDTNNMYKKLRDYYAQSDQNVLIVMFGDHTALFPNGGKIYEELGYYTSKDELNSRVVPMFMWSNYLDKPQARETPISFGFLGNSMIEYAGLPQSVYQAYLSQLKQRVGVATTGFVVGPDGTVYNRDDEFITTELSDYFNIVYDQLYGEGYLPSTLFDAK